MKLFLLLSIVVIVLGEPTRSGDVHPLSDEFIDIINSKNSTWRAGRNFHQSISMERIRNLVGVLSSSQKQELPVLWHEQAEIPEHFDAREKWPNCPTIKQIGDQGECASDWAFASAGTISDRICINSTGEKVVDISVNDILSCCCCCGACEGGSARLVWLYWITDGIVTGGQYGSGKGCRPYDIPPCEHFVNGTRPTCTGHTVDTPQCKNECIPGYPTPYAQDRYYAKKVYGVKPDVAQFQMEILKNGPVQGRFVVYEDFLHYKSGVYQHVHGYYLGVHAVKILGWGVENGTPYWLIANSWNSDWGDNGFVKFLRGNNECYIEDVVAAGQPSF